MSQEQNGRSAAIAYLVAGVASLAALGVMGQQAISDESEDRQTGDTTLHAGVSENRDRIAALENARASVEYNRGVSDQTLKQLAELTEHNRARIEAAFAELDTKIQREFALADDTLRAELQNLDVRLQGEISRGQAERRAALEELRQRIDVLDAWIAAAAKDRWTKEDQARFEDQAGLRLKP